MREVEELHALLLDKAYTVNDVVFLKDEVALVTYSVKEELETSLEFTNVVLAAFTTAYARMELARYITALNDNCLYFDTDSVNRSFLKKRIDSSKIMSLAFFDETHSGIFSR